MHNCSINIIFIMKRSILAFATCFFISVSTLTAKSLVLTLTDGTLVYYLLGGEENPMIHFVDGGVMVNADGYSFTNLKNIYISLTDDPNGIEHKLADAKASYRSNVLALPSADTESVKIYTPNGSLVEVPMRNESGFLFVDLNVLPQGIYAVKIGKTSLKVMKKD